MQQAIAGQANTVSYDIVSASTAQPIVEGAVTAYLRCREGANAGKWWDASGGDWSDTEVSAGSMTYTGGSEWSVEIAAGAWQAGATYSLYAKESGDLGVVYTETIHTWSPPTTGKGGGNWVYTLLDAVTDLPIADAEVWVSPDPAGARIVAYDHTDVNGQVRFSLADGIWYFWRRKTGYAFTNPDVEEVT